MKKNFVISKSEYFGKWPFTVDKIGIIKDGFALYVRANHKTYNLNGVAKKGSPLEEIWLMREGCEYRMPIGDLINLANERLR